MNTSTILIFDHQGINHNKLPEVIEKADFVGEWLERKKEGDAKNMFPGVACQVGKVIIVVCYIFN